MSTDVALISPFPCQEADVPDESGVAAYTARLARALGAAGLEVTVLAPKVAGEPARCEVDGIAISREYARGSAAWLGAARAALSTDAPIAHVQYETFLYGGASSLAAMPVALRTLRRRGRGPVVTMHQVVDPPTVDREFTRVNRVRVPSRAARLGIDGAQRVVERLSARTVVHERAFADVVQSATVVPIGLDVTSDGVDDPERRIAAKRFLGLSPDRLVVLCFGYLAPYKGLENALDAARLVGPSVELVVVGGPHPRLVASHDSYADHLAQRYDDIARFVGYVPDSNVAPWFHAADVLLLPYPRPFASSGPFALALGLGTPVLCSPALARVSGAPEVLSVPIEPDALASRLRELVARPRQLETLRVATLGLATGRSWDEVARRHTELYEEVIHADRALDRAV